MGKDIKLKNSMTKKIIKVVFRIIYQMIVILCLILAAVIILQKVTDSNRSIGGYRIFRVITGSMEPEYDIGEVVISKEIAPKDIKVGDDIVYLGTYGDYNGKIIMHSVIAIDKDENGNLNFHARGLHSSSVEDPQIKSNQIYGIVKFKSGLLTILYKLATNIYTLFVIITVLVLNVFISFKVSGKEEVQKLGEAIDYEEDEKSIENIDDIKSENEEENEEEYNDEENDEDFGDEIDETDEIEDKQDDDE